MHAVCINFLSPLRFSFDQLENISHILTVNNHQFFLKIKFGGQMNAIIKFIVN